MNQAYSTPVSPSCCYVFMHAFCSRFAPTALIVFQCLTMPLFYRYTIERNPVRKLLANRKNATEKDCPLSANFLALGSFRVTSCENRDNHSIRLRIVISRCSLQTFPCVSSVKPCYPWFFETLAACLLCLYKGNRIAFVFLFLLSCFEFSFSIMPHISCVYCCSVWVSWSFYSFFGIPIDMSTP